MQKRPYVELHSAITNIHTADRGQISQTSYKKTLTNSVQNNCASEPRKSTIVVPSTEIHKPVCLRTCPGPSLYWPFIATSIQICFDTRTADCGADLNRI